MTTKHLEATFEVINWDETPFDDGVGIDDGVGVGVGVNKLTEALVSRKYSGPIDGTSTTKWLMAYAPDRSATYVGLERFTGSVDGRRGTLVLLHDGAFGDGAATATLRIVSGTDELKQVNGSGSFRADPGGSVTLDIAGL